MKWNICWQKQSQTLGNVTHFLYTLIHFIHTHCSSHKCEQTNDRSETLLPLSAIEIHCCPRNFNCRCGNFNNPNMYWQSISNNTDHRRIHAAKADGWYNRDKVLIFCVHVGTFNLFTCNAFTLQFSCWTMLCGLSWESSANFSLVHFKIAIIAINSHTVCEAQYALHTVTSKKIFSLIDNHLLLSLTSAPLHRTLRVRSDWEYQDSNEYIFEFFSLR